MDSERYFTVDASLMQQLGAALISDDLQCLVELIKNAYDADAVSVKIIIDAPQQIIVEDNGHGMDEETIRRGWLTIANSLKAEQKATGTLTRKQRRTPLGDKGLGRLSTQRLGNHLHIETVPEGGTTSYTVDIDWTAFVAGQDLSKVPVQFSRNEKTKRTHGTRLVISELNDPDEWLRLKSEDLRLSLASLVSPYEEVASFRLQAFLNGTEVSPSLITANVRRAAWQRYEFSFDGEHLETKGSLRGQILRGNTTQSKHDYAEYFDKDDGAAFLEFFLANRRTKSLGISRAKLPGFLIEFEASRGFREIIGAKKLSNPGPFNGEVDSFSLDSQANAELVSDAVTMATSAEARQLVKDLSGIRVYRDGFIVRTDNDWLKLGEGQTRGGSFYGLRPANTMGYVAISASKNAAVRETTDRQGFIEDSYYRGFYEILQAFVRSANDTIEHLRRTWHDYVKRKMDAENDLPSRNPRVIEKRLKESFGRVGAVKKILTDASRALTAASEKDGETLFYSGAGAKEIANVQALIETATETLSEVEKRGGLAALLIAELDALNAKIGEVYELVSLGITSETLSHDISNILERLTIETAQIQKHARRVELEDLTIQRYFEVVRSAISGLERQLAHLDPALRYTREKREVFNVAALVIESAQYYEERFARKSLAFNVWVERDFRVEMNKGKLIQVLDNLLLNSEYWASLARVRANAPGGEVTVIVRSPDIIVFDSGGGIETLYEETLFDPFITAKPKGEGRGLGLFIATQLLELDGCALRLLPERNSAGRRFMLAIDLRGTIHD